MSLEKKIREYIRFKREIITELLKDTPDSDTTKVYCRGVEVTLEGLEKLLDKEPSVAKEDPFAALPKMQRNHDSEERRRPILVGMPAMREKRTDIRRR